MDLEVSAQDSLLVNTVFEELEFQQAEGIITSDEVDWAMNLVDSQPEGVLRWLIQNQRLHGALEGKDDATRALIVGARDMVKKLQLLEIPSHVDQDEIQARVAKTQPRAEAQWEEVPPGQTL